MATLLGLAHHGQAAVFVQLEAVQRVGDKQ
jgi:hypothetical protein